MPELNQNPEQKARDKIDYLPRELGWVVRHPKAINFSAGSGIAARECQIDVGPVDSAIFVNKKVTCIIEEIVQRSDAITNIDVLKLFQNKLDQVDITRALLS